MMKSHASVELYTLENRRGYMLEYHKAAFNRGFTGDFGPTISREFGKVHGAEILGRLEGILNHRQPVMITSRIGRRHQRFLLTAFSVFLLAGWRGSAVEAADTTAVAAPPNRKDLPARLDVKPAPDSRRPLPGTSKGLRGVLPLGP